MALSGILRVSVDAAGRFAGGRFTSLRLDELGIPHVDPSALGARLVSSVGMEDFGPSALVVRDDGRLRRATVSDTVPAERGRSL